MELDMTKGKPFKVILTFFIPLLLGDLLQQFYGIIDAIVIGKYVNTDAFAAVGSSGATTLFITSILLGLALGASSVFSKLYGAKDYENLKKSISTSLIFIFIVSLIITIITSLFLVEIVDIFRMPEAVKPYAIDYLRYVFYGFIFVGMYNGFSFVLRALGDSKTPLYFLIASCCSNLILDLLFVIVFKMGTAGAAIATLLTQAFSAIGCGYVMFKKLSFIDFSLKDLVFHKSCFNEIAQYSVLTAFQQSISSFGMMLVQGLVNTFGATTMAAFAAASKVDSVANAPLQDLGNSFSTFTAQNLGANKKERIKEGYKATVIMIIILSMTISLIAYIFAPQLIQLFVFKTETEVIKVGVTYLRFVSLFYVLLGFNVMYYGFFRGLSHMKVSILLTVISQSLRVILAYTLTPYYGFAGISYAIVIGWFLSDLLGLYYYRKLMQ